MRKLHTLLVKAVMHLGNIGIAVLVICRLSIHFVSAECELILQKIRLFMAIQQSLAARLGFLCMHITICNY